MRFRLATVNILMLVLLGCGTTRWTNTTRSATEQLLITDAMDRAVSRLDFKALAAKKVYIDSTQITKTTDYQYLVSTMRQHALADGCILKDKREEADYIVEMRVGAVGTDHHDVLVGVPANDLSSVVPISGIPASIPEISIIKKTEQRAVAKIAVFAYNRTTGRPVWQSGTVPIESKAKDVWILGAGPFQRGNIYRGMNFAGDRLKIPLISPDETVKGEVSVADEAYFVEPKVQIADTDDKKKAATPTEKTAAKEEAKPAGKVVTAGHSATGPATGDTPTEPKTSPLPTEDGTAEIKPSGPALPPKPIMIPDESNAAPLPAKIEFGSTFTLPLPGDATPDSTIGELPDPSWTTEVQEAVDLAFPSASYTRLRGQPADHSMLQ